MSELEIGAEGVAHLVVEQSHTAEAMSDTLGGEFPKVLATAQMIALMELAASKVLVPLLGEGELSVGVGVDIVHTAATPVGAPVTARATFTGMVGKIYGFEVVAMDPGGVCGKGRHTRAIVETSRIIAGAKKRTTG